MKKILMLVVALMAVGSVGLDTFLCPTHGPILAKGLCVQNVATVDSSTYNGP